MLNVVMLSVVAPLILVVAGGPVCSHRQDTRSLTSARLNSQKFPS
jgi:hypothetical protein